ncbi:2-phosphosulfolactate phosphatase [Ferviditalea candida]|uniref:Probable 2-phosphosulfolactate phosphatase n=1 Tax=Ferviditalea candida TaxID=3108399 RepID=A0ABU5ZG32_9BACL|nr:2-phosphosulfolactate phosphatase [Paenibacillaceae bacterium T2]
MRLDVIPSVNEARSDDLIHKTVIVIDVLRATSTIVTALAAGCAGIIPVETVIQAKNLREEGELLGGERYCKKITGFDLGNSPLEYRDHGLQGEKIIMTTTNGTRAMQKVQKASHVLLGSLLNARSCARVAWELKRDVVLVCAGTQDQFSLEDGLCAGCIVDCIYSFAEEQPEVNDFGLAMRHAYLHAGTDMQNAILSCANGKKLCRLGFEEDVLFCCNFNQFDVVPVLQDHILVKL